MRPRVHDIVAPVAAGSRMAADGETHGARAMASDLGDDFLTLREYELGDDLRRVHWRATARTGELMIRQNEARWRSRAVLLLDVRPGAYDDASFEVAVEATASVVARLVRLRRRVEVITSAGELLGTGGDPRHDVIDRLATVGPDANDRLEVVATNLRAHRRADLLIAVLGTVGQDTRRALAALSGMHVIAVLTRPSGLAPTSSLTVVDASAIPFATAWNRSLGTTTRAPWPHARLLAPVALAALSIGAAMSLARVFDSAGFVLPVIGAALLPYVIGAIGRRFGWPTAVTLGLSLVALVAYVVWALEPSTTRFGAPLGETWRVIGNQLSHGWHTLRTTPAPAPVTDGAVLLAVIVTWIMATCSDWLAFVRRAVLGALAPALVLFVWSSTLGTAEAWELSVAAFAVLASCFLCAQNLALLDRRRSWLVTRGATRAPSIVPTAIVAVVAIVGALALASVIPGAGADPILDFNTAKGDRAGGKSYRASIAPFVDVGEKLRNIDIPDLFTVQSPQPDYWRVTALDEYSAEGGGQWTLNAARGGKVEVGLPDTAPADAVRQVFDIGQLAERWLPAAYRPVTISLDNTLVVVSSWTLVTSKPSVRGHHYTVDSILGPSGDEVAAAQQARDQRCSYQATSGSSRRFRPTSRALDPPICEQDREGRRCDDAVREGRRAARLLPERDFRLRHQHRSRRRRQRDRDVPSPTARLLRAVRERVRGDGARGRAPDPAHPVGYTSGTKSGDVYTVGSHDAHAWPEVWLAGLGWTHLFDPTPATQAARAGGSELPGEVGVGSTPVTNPVTQPTLPPASTVPETTGTGGASTGTTPGGASNGTTAPATAAFLPPSVSTTAVSDNSVWGVIALVAAILALIVGAYVGIVLELKRRRRARRRAADPALAVQGAWHEALDRLHEARLSPDPALTPLELARVTPTRTTPGTARPMRALARTYPTTVRRHSTRRRRRAARLGFRQRAPARTERPAQPP